MTKTTIYLTISWLFIALFLYTAVSKLLAWQAFLGQVSESPLIGPHLARFAWTIPVVEISIAVILGLPRLRTAGLYASLSLMVGFTVYTIMLASSGPWLPCGCGGILESLPPSTHILLNLALSALALTGALLSRTRGYHSNKENSMKYESQKL